MTSTAVSSDPPINLDRPVISRGAGVWIALLAGAFIALFFNFIWRMSLIALGQWGGDWSHALVIPFISLYYVILKRQDLAQTPRRVFWPGLAVFFVGMLSYAWWIQPGRNDMLQGYSMILALLGLVLFLLGPAMMKTLWFPIVFLAFAVKVSDRIWDQIAWKLQVIASHAATIALNLFGIEATVRGSTIDLYRGIEKLEPLNVAEACAGLRMLMAFMALGVAMAFLFDRNWWQRLIMVLFTVPVAVGINVGRVTTLGVLHLVAPEAARGDFHKFVGLLMLIPALLIYMLMGWALDQILVEEESPAPPLAPAAMPGAAAPAGILWKPVGLGLLLGAGLTGLIGVDYALGWASLRDGVFGHELTSSLAQALLAAGVLALGGWGFLLFKLSKAHNEQNDGSQVFFFNAMALAILLTGVGGLWSILQANGVVLVKEPIALRRPLFHLPDRLGSWRKIHQDKPLSAEMIEELGTTQYISWIYSDEEATTKQPTRVRLHVAYYTGTPDTVPHVPERCYTAGGVMPVETMRVPISLSGAQYEEHQDGPVAFYGHSAQRTHMPAMQFNATGFTFVPPERPNQQANVVYFFAANGKFLATPDAVRFYGFDPRDRYSYYCKIEANFVDIADPQLAAERASAFFSAALPEIMACLPDWVDVKQGRYPSQTQETK